MSSRSESLDLVSYLLKEGLLKVFPEEVPDPDRQATLFYDDVPSTLLKKRKDLIDGGQGVREWFLVTEDADLEWAESLRGDYGVLVVDVDNLGDARKLLRSFLAAGRWSGWRDENPLFPELVLVGGNVEELQGVAPE